MPPHWSRLAYVTWRQHRVDLVGLLVLLGALCVVMGVTGVEQRQTGGVAFSVAPVAIILTLVPVLIAMFVTAPLLTREYERGTLRFAWTQGTSRTRWVTAELLLITAVSATACFGTAVLAGWWLHPMEVAGYVGPLDAQRFGLTPVTFPAWAVFGSAVGAFAGALTRHTLPAMALAAVGMEFSAGGRLGALGVHYGSGPGQFWAHQAATAVALTLLALALGAATVWLARHRRA